MKSSDWDIIAGKYHDEVISPFQKGVKNPLLYKVKELRSKKKVVADLGCGLGDLLGMLSEGFGEVYALDFSPAMIKKAKKRAKAKNIKFMVMDIRNVGKLEKTFDVAISSNSILFPDAASVKESLKAIRASLREDGVFLAIFPSMESILYQGFLIMDRQIGKIGDEKKAITSAKRIFESGKYDFMKSTFTEGGCIQKFFYIFELEQRLREAGFRNIKVSKVLYPWRDDIGGHEVFKGKPRMWDWFVKATR